MSELAQNENGERVPVHDQTVELKVTQCQPPGKPGAPRNVPGANGLQAYLPRSATAEDLRAVVRDRPGRFKLVQVDQFRKPIVGAEPFHIEFHDTTRLTHEADNEERDYVRELVRQQGEMVRSNNETVRGLFDRFAGILDASATLIRAADGAGLPAREPIAPVAQLVEPPPEPVPAANPGMQVIADVVAKGAPLLQHYILTKLGLSPDKIAALYGPIPVGVPPGVPISVPHVPAPPTSVKPAAPAATPVPVDPIAHMNAIEALLGHREKMIAYELIASMTPDQITTWRSHLCTMSAADAASAIRAEVASLEAKRNGGAS